MRQRASAAPSSALDLEAVNTFNHFETDYGPSPSPTPTPPTQGSGGLYLMICSTP